MALTAFCQQCGKEFFIRPYKSETAKYCSNECYYASKRHIKPETRFMATCPSCGQEFSTSIKKPIKYCSPKCNKERKENKHYYNCDCCGKEFLVHPSTWAKYQRGEQKTLTCSRECGKQLKRHGRDVTCDHCGKIFYRNQYQIDLGNHNFCSAECEFAFRGEEAREIRTCKLCGLNFTCIKSSPQEYCGRQCQTKAMGIRSLAKYSKGERGSVKSAPQIQLDTLLDNLGIKYTNEYNIKYYSVDTYLNESNLMIEVMGDYWHCSPIRFPNGYINDAQKKAIARDKSKHTYVLNKYNIEVLYLWEHDLIFNFDLCKLLVNEYIKSSGKLNNYHSFNYGSKDGQLILNKNIIHTPY